MSRKVFMRHIGDNVRCFGRITNFPMAKASAEVVQSTSLVDMFRKICSSIIW